MLIYYTGLGSGFQSFEGGNSPIHPSDPHVHVDRKSYPLEVLVLCISPLRIVTLHEDSGQIPLQSDAFRLSHTTSPVLNGWIAVNEPDPWNWPLRLSPLGHTVRVVVRNGQTLNAPTRAGTIVTNHWVWVTLSPSPAIDLSFFPPDVPHPAMRNKGLSEGVRDVSAFTFKVHDY